MIEIWMIFLIYPYIAMGVYTHAFYHTLYVGGVNKQKTLPVIVSALLWPIVLIPLMIKKHKKYPDTNWYSPWRFKL